MAFLDAVLTALVAVGMLYGLCALYGIEFKGFFVVLAILSAMLSVLLPRGQPTQSPQLVRSTLPLAIRVVVRWMVILANLLASGFVTKRKKKE